MTLPFPAPNLNLLQGNLPRIQESSTHAELCELKTTLEHIESSMNKIQTDKRALTWAETGSEILRYSGYIAIGIISL